MFYKADPEVPVFATWDVPAYAAEPATPAEVANMEVPAFPAEVALTAVPACPDVVA
jgi:hypothetical protein